MNFDWLETCRAWETCFDTHGKPTGSERLILRAEVFHQESDIPGGLRGGFDWRPDWQTWAHHQARAYQCYGRPDGCLEFLRAAKRE